MLNTMILLIGNAYTVSYLECKLGFCVVILTYLIFFFQREYVLLRLLTFAYSWYFISQCKVSTVSDHTVTLQVECL